MTTILPSSATSQIHTRMLDEHAILGTTRGLAKTANEDRIGYHQNSGTLRLCIADGHWGEIAADMIVRYWLDETMAFPATRANAIQATRTIESRLFDTLGRSTMDADHDRTAEAAFIVVEYANNQLHIISYGDCRLLVSRQGSLTYQLPMTPTWLGAFSHLGLRDRQTIDNALVYKSLAVAPDDVILLFTDGIDECVYEVPTISPEQLANFTTARSPQQAYDHIFKTVFESGAEDNASLAIISAR